ncbi:hypothetical protein GCV60_14745 [Listeria monocytogenes]|uniref:DUF7916 family protein n=1 Tax=Listeria TaxID=1637 RepID=UPI0011EB40BD|nr:MULTISPECIES: hypothetical protein [Listeria]EAF4531679.1 hypothetical protein [Listeria monocytogenes serotype 1/2a]EDH3594589.1 hypothetical protein [Listeria monocytogenes]MBC1385506.1 hypothetical protein [Listeria innocua]TYV61066.1 hypothetical protein FZ042_13130 [Listeria monocytogenes]
MKRILACEASDFGQKSTPFELKKAIKLSEGRVVLVNLAAEEAPLYPEVTNGEMAAAFGADLILLKAIDVQKMVVGGLGEINHLSEVRQLTGTGVGINLEIADNVANYKRVNDESIQEAMKKGADFLSLTAYVKPETTMARIVADIQLTREYYQGFLMLNPVVSHGMDLSKADLLQYVKAGVDMIVLPSPGSVAGVTEDKLAEIISSVRAEGCLVSCTVGTSQEGTDKETIQQIALSAKRAGADVFELGDAGVSGMPVPTTILDASISIRGRRHTFVRMARSSKR